MALPDVSQWGIGCRTFDTIAVPPWVLWWYPRLAMSLVNANVIVCIT